MPNTSFVGVTVVVEPFAFLVEQIGGSRVHVEVLVPPGKEPEHYQATPEKIAAMSRSRILFYTGMPFEKTLLPKLQRNAPNLTMVDLRTGLKLRTLELHHHDECDGVHADDIDPHIWFAPSALITEAATVLAALVEVDPDAQTFYRENYTHLVAEIETVQKQLADQLAPLKGQTVYVFHPSYGYFCDEFGLKQRAIEFEGKTPKPQQLAALVAETKQESPVIFIQPEFNRSPAQALAEAVNGTTVIHSALERNVLKSIRRFTDLQTEKPTSMN
jgi:zinc transport system substrate-binding protein